MSEEYDVIVLGTGVVECIVSGLLSVSGKKVLHIDRNPYYGGESASMNLTELYQKFKGTNPPENFANPRKYNIDLILKLIMSCDKMAKKLTCLKVHRYMKFKEIDGSYVYRSGKLYKVPVTEGEVLTSSLIGFFQKLKLRSFISAFEGCLDPLKKYPDGITKNSSMEEVYNRYGLNKENQELVGHVLALHQNDEYLNQPCYKTLERIQLYKDSLMLHGKSPYIYPLYGLGELPQAFTRISAVFGGTYMLNKPVNRIEMGEDGKVCQVVFADETYKTKIVIGDPSYFPDRVKKVRSVVRCICLLNHPVTAIAPSMSAQIIIPASQVGRKSDIYVSVISSDFNICPPNMFVAIVASIVESQDPKIDIKVGLDLLNPITEQFFSTYDVYEPLADGTSDNVFISKSYDATTHFETAISDIDDLWKRITGQEFDENFYYKFDYNIFAELVCSEDGIFTRKELGEIAQKVAIEQTVVFRQFDNLSNIFKSCENINNIKNIYEHIRSKYMICTDLVRLKSIPFDVFIKGTYFIIFHWFLTDDMPSLTIPSLSDTSNAIGDVDKEFFTQLKYMVAKFSDKQFYEYFKMCYKTDIIYRICQENIKTAGLKNLDSSDSIKFAFKTLCSNIIYMANRLNCTKDLNDFFFVIVDKLIIPSKSKDLSEEVFQTILKIMLDSSNELIDIEQEIVNIFQKFMNVLIGCSTLMYPYKYEQTH
ncbi:hypothetical protein HZS_3282 [Henneguya salminicola]|nr:hypothetical protein HZS_3282 [Henneguya salminicola]